MKKDGRRNSFVPPHKSGTVVISDILGAVLSKLFGREGSLKDRVKEIKDGMIHYSKSEQGK